MQGDWSLGRYRLAGGPASGALRFELLIKQLAKTARVEKVGEYWQVVNPGIRPGGQEAGVIYIQPGPFDDSITPEILRMLNEQFENHSFMVFVVLDPDAKTSDIPDVLRRLPRLMPTSDQYTTFEEYIDRKFQQELPSIYEAGKPLVFLSHAQEDKVRVEKIRDAMRLAGLDPWYDLDRLIVGDPWADEISRAIKRADFFAFFISRRSIAKRGFINKEVQDAIKEHQMRPHGIAYMLPVRLDPISVPDIALDSNLRLPDLHWTNLFADDEKAFTAFAESIWAQWRRRNTDHH